MRWLIAGSYISQNSMATLRDRGPQKEISPDTDKEVELIAA